MLEMNRDEINKLFQDGMSGKLEQNHELLIHLGGGVYVTVGEKFPTVDIRHFWKPIDSDKPVPTYLFRTYYWPFTFNKIVP
jgi:hypothetical protein